jgi:hypothetical protein
MKREDNAETQRALRRRRGENQHRVHRGHGVVKTGSARRMRDAAEIRGNWAQAKAYATDYGT